MQEPCTTTDSIEDWDSVWYLVPEEFYGMQPGEMIGGRFRIESQAGKGGMATVFRATDLQSGTPVALKVLDSGGWASQFIREAQLLSTLQHSAVVQYLTHGSTERGELYLVMEWLEGEDLSRRLVRDGLSVGESITLLRHVAEALAVTHEKGIIHRDIKPSNLFLPNGRVEEVKILDFGIALLTDGDHTRTPTGIRIGTPGYMSPERARGEKDIDARADIFSLGCVLFECLAGRPAFSGEHTMAVLSKILLEEGRPAKLREGLPAALDDLLSAMLAKDPSRRPQDANAVVDALSAPTILEAQAAHGPVAQRHKALTTAERQLICAVLIPSASEIVPALSEVATRYGGKLSPLTDGSAVIPILRQERLYETALDQATRAARCALALYHSMPGVSLSLTAGWGESRNLPQSEVIDSGPRLLRERADSKDAHVWLDPLSAALLESRFQINGDDALYLGSERDALGDPRALLGHTTVTVGRERELSRLETIFGECLEESAARAVLIRGPAGAGKSRLLRELLRLLRARSEPIEILISRGDSMRVGSPFGLIAQWRASIAEIENSEQMLLALQAFLVERCAHHPVVLILEDLHWADAPSVQLIDAALRHLRGSKLFVIALARPEIHDRFPALWASRGLITVEFGELSKKSSRALVHQVLGDSISQEAGERLCEQAGGNALYLEEFIRFSEDGDEQQLPEVVLAMGQAYLDGLPTMSRRVLRAASIFGGVFWRGGVMALLGDILSEELLRDLCDRRLVARSVACRFSGEVEYTFRRDLVREAAYAMLTEEDRLRGHRLAAEWLCSVKETNARLIAEHFDQGEAFERAAEYYEEAAAQALDTNDCSETITLAERALVLDPSRERQGSLQQMIAEARLCRCEQSQSLRWGIEAMRCLATGSAQWYRAAELVILASCDVGDHRRLYAVAAQLQQFDAEAQMTSPQLCAWVAQVSSSIVLGHYGHALELLAKLERLETKDPALLHLLAYRALYNEDLVSYADLCEAAALGFEQRGDIRHALLAAKDAAHGQALLGDYARSEQLLRQTIARAEHLKTPLVIAAAKHHLGVILLHQGSYKESLLLGQESIALCQENPRQAGWSWDLLARALLHLGELEEAEHAARESIAISASFPNKANSLATLGRVLLARGRTQESLTATQQSMEMLTNGLSSKEEGEALIRLSFAESLHAANEHQEAKTATTKARDYVLKIAAQLHDPHARQRFLTCVPENARALALSLE
jgi:tetratricopeptide (TPR) repeat protein